VGQSLNVGAYSTHFSRVKGCKPLTSFTLPSSRIALRAHRPCLPCGAGLGNFPLPTCQDFCLCIAPFKQRYPWKGYNLTEDVLDKWARNLLGYKIPHTFVDFPWWVLAIYMLWRPRPAVTRTSCRPPLATNLGLMRLTTCLADSAYSCCPRT
jgi:hypothetical protein